MLIYNVWIIVSEDMSKRRFVCFKIVVFMLKKKVFCNDFKLLNANNDGQFSMSIYNVWIVVSEDISEHL